MQIKNTMLHVAAATTITAVVSMGAVAPALAAGKEGGQDRPGNSRANGNASDKSENGNGHTPVTVCHRTGKAGYIVLTMDENALEAHLGHGDIYPVPEGGCPTTEADDNPGAGPGKGETPAEPPVETPAEPPVETPGDTPVKTPVEAPVEAPVESGDAPADVVDTATTTRGQVLGVESSATTTGTTAPAAAAPAAAQAANAPAAGVLPDTGADEYLWATLAGLGLLTAGGAVLARRRAQDLG